jgi:hypothetical protein
MRRREPPQRYLPDEEATRPQHGGTRRITAADLELATRSLAERTGAAVFREMSLRELRQELATHLRMPLDALEEHRFAIRSIAVSLSAELEPAAPTAVPISTCRYQNMSLSRFDLHARCPHQDGPVLRASYRTRGDKG